ncbi:MAG: NAD/FAD-binding protein, partial [Acidimicrobiia bacterium]|nr:NAD/FAD-binding protein [Acidimicrobiia bacterium]
IACHADDALGLLSDPSPDEKTVLGAIRFQSNRATLHTDTSVLPPTPRAWAAWNYERNEVDQRSARLTYDLTRLQRLPGRHRYLVSLNMEDRIDGGSVLETFDYAHPVFDREAVEAQRRFEDIDGALGTHFVGAWWGYGFHEDGVVSALRVCRRLGVTW